MMVAGTEVTVLVAKEILVGPPRLTRFEKARIIGARALQLALGAMPLIDVSELRGKDFVEIAEEELKRGVLPITILRKTRSGKEQAIPLSWLLKEESR